MVAGDYSQPLMKLGVWQKDMAIIADFAREAGCPIPLFETTAPLYTAAIASGEDQDTAAVCRVLEEMAGVRRKKVRSAKYKSSKWKEEVRSSKVGREVGK